METTKINKTWLEWLEKERCISEEVATEAGLYFRGPLSGSLVMPVYDLKGTFLFNKYRRSPLRSAGPKYYYEGGASAALYGAETLKELTSHSTVVVTEGELDSLALRTININAVSSTGGAGTFKEDWVPLLEGYNTVLLFDGDMAGVTGMLRAASLFPNGVRVAWMPCEIGKDPTEVIHKGGEDRLRTAITRSLKVNVREGLKQFMEGLKMERRIVMADPERTPLLLDFAIAWAQGELEKREASLFDTTVTSDDRDDKVVKAKRVPIRSLVKVDQHKKTVCLWHEDKNPSMHVFDDNHAYCFVCDTYADAIAFYMKLSGKDFLESVNEMNSI